MFKNYVKIAWRNIIKRRFFSLVNIIGLATGITFTLLTATYIYEEMQVNSELKNAASQYIIQSKWKDPNMGMELTTIAQLPIALKQAYPSLVANYYHWDGVTSTISKGDQHFREGIQIGDSTLLSMYGFKLLYGNASTALSDPFSVVITENKAMKYFGQTNVIGQTITIENFSGARHDFTVSGVMAKMGKNSVVQLNDNNENEFFIPVSAAKFMGRTTEGWQNPTLIGYLELKSGVKPQDLEKPMLQLIKSNAPAQIAKNLTPYLVPLKGYNLQANNGVIGKMLYTLSAIALFILLMAVINFVNLCVSQSASRMREMGVRKVLGGLKKQLIFQFLTESVLLVMLATVIAMLLYIVVHPYFNDMLGKQTNGLFTLPAWLLLTPFALALFIGLAAGIYPAFVLSSLKSVDSLKGKLGSVNESVLMRKSLVAFQFGIATLVFISALVISQQVKLFFSKDLGFDKSHVVYAQVPRDWSVQGVQKMETVRSQLAKLPEVSSVSLSWEIPDGRNAGPIQVYKHGADSTQSITVQQLGTDNQYANTYNIALKAGRFFAPVYTPGEANKLVINQTLAKVLGYTNLADAINQQVHIQGSPDLYTIDGVTGNFHFESMQQQIQPIAFMNVNATTYYRYLSIKLKPGNVAKGIEAVQQEWNTLLPGAPFEYNFIDDALKKVYKTELQLKKAAYMATTLAIIIVFLGVLGLISLSVQKRTKEIGIRKVLGSSIAGIISLFMKEFLLLVLLAGLIACPVAYFMMQNWLNDYAYKVSLTLHPFLISIALLTFITALLIALQTVKAAVASPVKSLRSQ